MFIYAENISKAFLWYKWKLIHDRLGSTMNKTFVYKFVDVIQTLSSHVIVVALYGAVREREEGLVVGERG